MEEFYAGKSIFVTGATGFVGKVLLEKILRCLPGVTHVYILIRPKQNKDVNTRFQELINSPAFDRLKRENPKMLDKVVPISGDISLPDLGMSSADIATLKKNVSVVIHSAATVKFHENLKIAINLNVRGVQRVVQLCQGMDTRPALVYVSTAYSNCDQRSPVQEKVYPVPVGAMELLESIDGMSDDFVNKHTPFLIRDKPNTYTYTKAIAERIFEKEVASQGIPACILRPSIVSPAWAEPVPGWTDSYTGSNEFSLLIGNGLLNIIYGDLGMHIDITPVDMVANMTLVAAWQTAINPGSLKVYNCCSGPTNPLPFRRFLNLQQENYRDLYPLSRAVWYPAVTATLNRTWYRICWWRQHYLPAWLIDTWFKVAGSQGQANPNMRKIARKVEHMAKTVEIFTSRGWVFERRNVDKLEAALNKNPGQRVAWSFNFNDFTWKEYMERCCQGVRRYLMHDSDAAIPAARKRMERLRWAHTINRTTTTLTAVALPCAAMVGIFSFWNSSLREEKHDNQRSIKNWVHSSQLPIVYD